MDSSFIFLGIVNQQATNHKYFVMHLSNKAEIINNIKIRDTNSVYLNISKVIATPDNGYILVGNSISKIDSIGYIFCIKYNAQGDTLWNKAIVVDSMYFPEIADAKLTTDVGIIILANDNRSDTGHTIILIKLDSMGNSAHIRRLNTYGLSAIRATQILEHNPGQYSIIGRTNRSNSSFIVKMNSIDSIEWYKEYVYIQNAGMLYKNNSYYVAGNNPMNEKLFVKLDYSGNIAFIRKYDNVFNSYANDFTMQLIDYNDSFYFYTNIHDFHFSFNYNNWSVILDTLGNVGTMFNMYGQLDAKLGVDHKLRFIYQGPLSGVKYTYEYDHIGFSIYEFDTTVNHYHCFFLEEYLRAISTYGIPIYNLSIGIDTLGMTTNYSLIYDTMHIEAFSSCIAIFGGVGSVASIDNITLYPNPTNGLCTIQNEGEVLKEASIIIYDALGKEQSRINTDIASSTSLDLQFLQNGMYYYSIISQNNIVKQGKFVLLK